MNELLPLPDRGVIHIEFFPWALTFHVYLYPPLPPLALQVMVALLPELTPTTLEEISALTGSVGWADAPIPVTTAGLLATEAPVLSVTTHLI